MANDHPKSILSSEDYRLHSRLGFQLSRLSRLMQGRLEVELAKHDMTRLKWCILSGVAFEKLDAPSELADHIGVTRPAISRLLKVMIKDGLIERQLVEADGRSRVVTLTALGEEKLRLCRPLVEENQDHFVSKIAAKDLKAFHETLRSLIAGEDDKFEDI